MPSIALPDGEATDENRGHQESDVRLRAGKEPEAGDRKEPDRHSREHAMHGAGERRQGAETIDQS